MSNYNPKIGVVTVIGTGGGYGESVVVHLGDNDWMIVDSCQNPDTKKSLALEYLEEIGVDYQKQVKLIVCTHWHDDHILGMSQIVNACSSAEFYFASCTDKDKFLLMLEIDEEKSKDGSFSSSTTEFYNCLTILADRDQIVRRASQDRLIFNRDKNGIKSEVFCLSPSDYTLLQFDKELSSLIDSIKERNRKTLDKRPNEKSVVILIKLNDHRIILGADLEISTNGNEGWGNVLTSKSIDSRRASMFKVPHHGSNNGYSKEVWEKILEVDAISKVTLWNRKVILPQMDSLKVLAQHTKNIYLTANINEISRKAKKREESIEKAILQKKPSLSEVKFKRGIIQSTIDITNKASAWDVKALGVAIHANKALKL